MKETWILPSSKISKKKKTPALDFGSLKSCGPCAWLQRSPCNGWVPFFQKKTHKESTRILQSEKMPHSKRTIWNWNTINIATNTNKREKNQERSWLFDTFVVFLWDRNHSGVAGHESTNCILPPSRFSVSHSDWFAFKHRPRSKKWHILRSKNSSPWQGGISSIGYPTSRYLSRWSYLVKHTIDD